MVLGTNIIQSIKFQIQAFKEKLLLILIKISEGEIIEKRVHSRLFAQARFLKFGMKLIF